MEPADLPVRELRAPIIFDHRWLPPLPVLQRHLPVHTIAATVLPMVSSPRSAAYLPFLGIPTALLAIITAQPAGTSPPDVRLRRRAALRRAHPAVFRTLDAVAGVLDTTAAPMATR